MISRTKKAVQQAQQGQNKIEENTDMEQYLEHAPPQLI